MSTGDAPNARYQKERERRLPNAVESGDVTERDAELIEEFLDTIDPDAFNPTPSDLNTVAQSTLRSYAKNLRLVAKKADAPLNEMDAEAINAVMEEMSQDLSNNTIAQRQSALRVFYRYHKDLGVDPELIIISRPDTSTVDARDTFDREEVDAIREELKTTRDRAIFDLMLYTGQRARAIQTLRVKDLDIPEGRFHLNTDEAGMKGAQGMRPMLLAKGSMAEWMKDHPAPEDDNYVFTSLPGSARGTAGEQLYQSSITRPIREACKRAGIRNWEDRGHLHNLRHSFVSWAYLHQDMDVSTIKYMGGWAQSSQTFEETYFNILDTEHAEKAEQAAGVSNGSEEEPDDLTPEQCPVCDHVLPKNALACPNCGTQLPGAQGLEQKVREGKQQAESLEGYKEADLLGELIKRNPELANQIDLD